MKKIPLLGIFAAASLASCGSADVDVKAILASHIEQHKLCLSTQDAKNCDVAIASLEKDVPLLKNACSSGNNYACGLFPGYDQGADSLRSIVKMCVEKQVDPSLPDNLKQIAQQASKASCDRLKLIGLKQ